MISALKFQVLALAILTLNGQVVSQEKSRVNIFNSDPIHMEDLGAPPATSTIILYDCTATHRAKADNPGAFQVFHNSEWWTQQCQEGLIWNQTLCRCEYPNGRRPERECREYRAVTTEPSGQYEQFVNGNWIRRDCSLAVAGLVWDQDTCHCVWGPKSKEMITGQGVTPCDIMLNMTFEEGLKDTGKGSFVEISRGPVVPIFNLDPGEAVDGSRAAFFSETALNIWYFASNEMGTSLRVEFRFKMTNDPSNRDKYQIFLSNGCNVSNPGYTTPSLAIGYRPADQSYLLAFETASARKAIVCTKRLGAYNWHTVSLIYEDGTLLLRVDDQPCIISQDFTGPIQKTPCPLTIGADPLERQSMYKGYLDNLLVARYCRRFIDSDPAEVEKKGPMPVESAPNVLLTAPDDQGYPDPRSQQNGGKTVNELRRGVSDTKYLQVVGQKSFENPLKKIVSPVGSDAAVTTGEPGRLLPLLSSAYSSLSQTKGEPEAPVFHKLNVDPNVQPYKNTGYSRKVPSKPQPQDNRIAGESALLNPVDKGNIYYLDKLNADLNPLDTDKENSKSKVQTSGDKSQDLIIKHPSSKVTDTIKMKGDGQGTWSARTETSDVTRSTQQTNPGKTYRKEASSSDSVYKGEQKYSVKGTDTQKNDESNRGSYSEPIADSLKFNAITRTTINNNNNNRDIAIQNNKQQSSEKVEIIDDQVYHRIIDDSEDVNKRTTDNNVQHKIVNANSESIRPSQTPSKIIQNQSGNFKGATISHKTLTVDSVPNQQMQTKINFREDSETTKGLKRNSQLTQQTDSLENDKDERGASVNKQALSGNVLLKGTNKAQTVTPSHYKQSVKGDTSSGNNYQSLQENTLLTFRRQNEATNQRINQNRRTDDAENLSANNNAQLSTKETHVDVIGKVDSVEKGGRGGNDQSSRQSNSIPTHKIIYQNGNLGISVPNDISRSQLKDSTTSDEILDDRNQERKNINEGLDTMSEKYGNKNFSPEIKINRNSQLIELENSNKYQNRGKNGNSQINNMENSFYEDKVYEKTDMPPHQSPIGQLDKGRYGSQNSYKTVPHQYESQDKISSMQLDEGKNIVGKKISKTTHINAEDVQSVTIISPNLATLQSNDLNLKRKYSGQPSGILVKGMPRGGKKKIAWYDKTSTFAENESETDNTEDDKEDNVTVNRKNLRTFSKTFNEDDQLMRVTRPYPDEADRLSNENKVGKTMSAAGINERNRNRHTTNEERSDADASFTKTKSLNRQYFSAQGDLNEANENILTTTESYAQKFVQNSNDREQLNRPAEKLESRLEPRTKDSDHVIKQNGPKEETESSLNSEKGEETAVNIKNNVDRSSLQGKPLSKEPSSIKELPHMRYNVNGQRYPKPQRSPQPPTVNEESDAQNDADPIQRSLGSSRSNHHTDHIDSAIYDHDVPDDVEAPTPASDLRKKVKGHRVRDDDDEHVGSEPYHNSESVHDSTDSQLPHDLTGKPSDQYFTGSPPKKDTKRKTPKTLDSSTMASIQLEQQFRNTEWKDTNVPENSEESPDLAGDSPRWYEEEDRHLSPAHGLNKHAEGPPSIERHMTVDVSKNGQDETSD